MSEKKLRAGVINVTGYAGTELARLLAGHPYIELTAVTGRSAAGKRLADVFPHLFMVDLPITETLEGDVDVVFSALPHAASAEACARFVRAGLPVVDISADFRLHDRDEYESWYKVTHPEPGLLASAVYGLPELHREAIRETKLVANPGCYPTGAILALAPAIRAGLISGDVIVDAKSGVSGAGRSLDLKYHFGEMDESVAAYALTGHRHMPEIRQELAALREAPPPRVTFVPHLIPMVRGILTTCYADLDLARLGPDPQAEVAALYRDAYAGEPFTHVLPAPPQTKHTSGSNYCLVHPVVDARAGRLVVVAVLDNLVKGAAGSAIENANLMLGLPEDAGLRGPALYP